MGCFDFDSVGGAEEFPSLFSKAALFFPELTDMMSPRHHTSGN